MNKYINFTIYGLLVLSLWALLSVGTGLIPLIDNSRFSRDFCIKFNNVALNLAYSYFAGFIMFTLTVTIPQFKRRKTIIPLIKRYVNMYYGSIEMDFFMFCVENKSITSLDKSDESFMSDYRIFMNKQFGDKMFQGVINKKTDKERYESIVSFREEDTNFLNKIISYEDYLTTEQTQILNSIKLHQISYAIDSFEGLKEFDNKINDIIFNVLNQHLKLAKNLKETFID